MKIIVGSMLVALALSDQARAQDAASSLRLVLPDLPSGTRLMGFSFKIASGRVVMLHDVPAGWHVEIDNDPSWQASIKANAVVGAAALETGALGGLFTVADAPAVDRVNPQDAIKITGSIDVLRDGELRTVQEVSVQLRPVSLNPARQ